jgi:hypothetical protein
MRRGEIAIIGIMGVVVASLMIRNAISLRSEAHQDPGIPFYSTANPQMMRDAGDLYRSLNCRQCHSLWTVKSAFESVPAPALDGIGSLRTEQWFYSYFSAPDPQSMLPSRLKPEYRMPSLAELPDGQRRLLAAYMASLKVKDWYLNDARAAEYEKLTGKAYSAAHAEN